MILAYLTEVDEVMQNGKRRLLMHYIRNSPGGTFREICRETSLAPGTTRHHLNILKRVKLVLEQPFRTTLRFFPTTTLFKEHWRTYTVLREVHCLTVFSAVSALGAARQREILSELEEMALGRSAIQAKLARLEEEGLIQSRLQGRCRVYMANPVPAQVLEALRIHCLHTSPFQVLDDWVQLTPEHSQPGGRDIREEDLDQVEHLLQIRAQPRRSR